MSMVSKCKTCLMNHNGVCRALTNSVHKDENCKFYKDKRKLSKDEIEDYEELFTTTWRW